MSLTRRPATAVTPLESEIRTLADGLRSIRDEQAYMMARERTHQGSECCVFLHWRRPITIVP